jgi:hypothetical protein
MKALAFILITRTPGESSLRVTRPLKSARVRKFSGLGFTSFEAQPLSINMPITIERYRLFFRILAPDFRRQV